MEFEQINKKYNTEFTNKLFENRHIFYEILEACGNKFWVGCGSYLFDGQTYKYCELMYEKQELLFNSAKTATKVLEIGTYMGHSAFIMLLSNPRLKITCVDISDELTRAAIAVLNKYFNNAITFIHGDSIYALNHIDQKFDFFHIDGHHDNNYISNEFYLIQKLNSRTDNVLRVVFDDAYCLKKLQTDIQLQYYIINKTSTTCSWNNAYFEIQL